MPVCVNDMCCRGPSSRCDTSNLPFGGCCEGQYCRAGTGRCETCLAVGAPAPSDCEGCCTGVCYDAGSGMVCSEP